MPDIIFTKEDIKIISWLALLKLRDIAIGNAMVDLDTTHSLESLYKKVK